MVKAQKNIRKAQEAWQKMSSRARAIAQPEGEQRTKPGMGGSGRYYHIEVRPKTQFTSFKTHDIGRSGHTQRVAGRRKSGGWATQKWLISKRDAHVENGKLVADDSKVRQILGRIPGEIKRKRADVFIGRPLHNVPEKNKPTPAQRRARQQNIKKAQRVRWS